MNSNLTNYISYMDKIIKSKKRVDYDKVKDNHLVMINFFQYERLVHLIVIMFYVLFTILFIYISIFLSLFLIIAVIMLLFLIFYVIFYFKLEKNISYMYGQYEKIIKK